MKLRTLTVACLAIAWLFPFSATAESSFDEEIRLLTEMLDLKPGAVFADIGAGEGQYAAALAKVVGAEGRAFATELDEEKLVELRKISEDQGLPQFSVVDGQYESTGLEPASCDAVFLRDVYHHITAPEPFMASLFETVRPGGRLVLIDFPPTIWLALFTPEGIPENRGGHGIHTELLIEEAKAAGFVPIRTVEVWPSNNFVTRTYAVAFEKPSAATTAPSGSTAPSTPME